MALRAVLRQSYAIFCENCKFAICRLILKICGFAICGLALIRSLRICNNSMSPRICGFPIWILLEKVCMPTSECLLYIKYASLVVLTTGLSMHQNSFRNLWQIWKMEDGRKGPWIFLCKYPSSMMVKTVVQAAQRLIVNISLEDTLLQGLLKMKLSFGKLQF